MLTLLVNPAAGGGRAQRRAHALHAALLRHRVDDVSLVHTTQRGDERRLAAEATARGARLLVVVGGDGSVHHAARGLLEAGGTLPFAIVAGGTGNDFVKSLDAPAHDVDAMAARIAQALTAKTLTTQMLTTDAHGGASPLRRIDVGVIDDVPFVNAAGMGFDVVVLERMAQHAAGAAGSRTIGGGTVAYVSTALGALFGYPGFDATLSVHDAPATPTSRRHLLTVFANGRCFGGAFRIAPTAHLHDGLLDIVDIGALSSGARLGVFARATRGTHLGHGAVTHARTAHTTVTCAEPPAFEADGELYRARDRVVQVTVRPGALTVLG